MGWASPSLKMSRILINVADVEVFYDEKRSLLPESGNVEKLRLYFELQHGEIEWRQGN